MKLKNHITICMNLLSEDLYSTYSGEYSNLDINRLTPLSASHAKRTKGNPHLIWHNLISMQDSYNEFAYLEQQSTIIQNNIIVEIILSKGKLYLSIVERLIEELHFMILQLSFARKLSST